MSLTLWVVLFHVGLSKTMLLTTLRRVRWRVGVFWVCKSLKLIYFWTMGWMRSVMMFHRLKSESTDKDDYPIPLRWTFDDTHIRSRDRRHLIWYQNMFMVSIRYCHWIRWGPVATSHPGKEDKCYVYVQICILQSIPWGAMEHYVYNSNRCFTIIRVYRIFRLK